MLPVKSTAQQREKRDMRGLRIRAVNRVLAAMAVAGGWGGPVPDETGVRGPVADMTEKDTTMNKKAEALEILADFVGSWTLIALDGEPFEFAGNTPTLEIHEDGSVGGSSGVNRYTTKIGSDGVVEGKISLGQAASTRMAGPPRAMAFERHTGD